MAILSYKIFLLTILVLIACITDSYSNEKGLGFIKYPNEDTEYQNGYRVGYKNAALNYKSDYFLRGLFNGVLLNACGAGLVMVKGMNSTKRPRLSVWSKELKEKKIEYVIGYLDGYEKLAHNKNRDNALFGGILGAGISTILIIALVK